MYNAQLGLINHIGNSTLEIATIEAYAGQINTKDLTVATTKLPAVFPFLRPSNPVSEVPVFTFDCFVVTKSEVYNTKTNALNNLQLSADLCAYFKNNFDFSYNGTSYCIDTESISAQTFMIDKKFTIIIVTVIFKGGMV
jgi:hypothetical protein